MGNIRFERVGTETASTSTDTATTGIITGEIESIKIVVSASTDFKIYTTNSPVTEYLFGTSSTAVTVASSKIYYPRVNGNLNTDGSALGASNKTNAFCKQVINSSVKVDASSLTALDTWSVEIAYRT